LYLCKNFTVISRMMATNYIGAFWLTKQLLPLLKNSPVPSRIVNVTSFTHRNGTHISDVHPLKPFLVNDCYKNQYLEYSFHETLKYTFYSVIDSTNDHAFKQI
ncbi:NAD(P)-binding domain containing protein, partial [Trema orientale]